MNRFLKTSTILKEVLFKVEEYSHAYICICIEKVSREHTLYALLFGKHRFENLKLEVQALLGNWKIAEGFLHEMSGQWPTSKTAKEFRIMLLEMLIKEYESKGD